MATLNQNLQYILDQGGQITIYKYPKSESVCIHIHLPNNRMMVGSGADLESSAVDAVFKLIKRDAQTKTDPAGKGAYPVDDPINPPKPEFLG